MLDLLLDFFIERILDMILRRFGVEPDSKLFPRDEDIGPITEKEKLRDRLEDRTRCLNKRM